MVNRRMRGHRTDWQCPRHRLVCWSGASLILGWIFPYSFSSSFLFSILKINNNIYQHQNNVLLTFFFVFIRYSQQQPRGLPLQALSIFFELIHIEREHGRILVVPIIVILDWCGLVELKELLYVLYTCVFACLYLLILLFLEALFQLWGWLSR